MAFIPKLRLLLLVYVCFICYSRVVAEDVISGEDIENFTIILPHVYKPLEMRYSISMAFTRLPIDWVETTVDVPIFQLTHKMGLPSGFSLESSFQSIYVSNQLRSGPRWNFETGKFSFAGGIDAGFLFGRMEISNFNNKAIGWSLYPVLSIGFNTKELAFTLSAEYSSLKSLKISSGDVEISNAKNFKSGHSISLFMEQKLWKKHVLILGFINNFQKFYFPAWPAFSTFNRQYYIPQFYLGLVL